MERSRWAVIAAFVLVTSANQMLWLTLACAVTTEAARHYGVSERAIGALPAVSAAVRGARAARRGVPSGPSR